ncbi:zinc ribbon domain-containing protein [Haloplanus litoreus]|uniref:Zinc ribbon domain-containing protein n=1 Tax=Haloplanus litoreus TaxID=767515 RepID=A0ABD6A411_9EURY
MTVTIQCRREDCGRVFEVDADAESARCPACGREHSLEAVTGHDDGRPDVARESDADVAVSGADLAGNDLVIEIRIRLETREAR